MLPAQNLFIPLQSTLSHGISSEIAFSLPHTNNFGAEAKAVRETLAGAGSSSLLHSKQNVWSLEVVDEHILFH